MNQQEQKLILGCFINNLCDHHEHPRTREVSITTRVPKGHGIREKSLNLKNKVQGPGKVREFDNYLKSPEKSLNFRFV